MPQIELTAVEGSLTSEGATTIQRDLATTLLKWEGAPDNAFFRAQAWSYLHAIPAGGQITAEDELPRFRVDVTVPAGALNDEARAGLVGDVTRQVLAAAGLDADEGLRVWVFIHEQPDGTWGAGGTLIRYADLVALAKRR
ncbi:MULTISPECIES: tautomerase family protein [Tsukamurella]|uniref:4-oxalocrotonate tautomerase n=2 Tax=Tsukamurella TaxID=2060 RepID=A0A5C5RYU9_9ACTN|nr:MULTISPECIES: tautomerase family protein [Tsukamurella]NMD55939.1 4-oxalocrotonate tautomerase [Tsukamurella columbiensis]TWS27620.1 4-oxalocrotonate tautomerase [Tsukamurella conjunctivitidis]